MEKVNKAALSLDKNICVYLRGISIVAVILGHILGG